MPLPPTFVAALLLFVTLAAVYDLASRRIPNRLLLAGLAAALLLHTLAGAPGWRAPWSWLAGAATGLVLFLPLYLLRGMAAGDVKLMAMVGAFAGPLLALKIGLASCLAGGVMALAILLYRRRCGAALRNLRFMLTPLLARLLWRGGAGPVRPTLPPGGSVGGMPYGLAIAAATLALIVLRPDWL